jgi:hypothetical protein
MSLRSALSAFLFVWTTWALCAGASQEKSLKPDDQIHYEMSRVSNTRLRFPRLTAYKDIKTMIRVNTQIDELSKEFGCPTHDKHDWYRIFSRVEYAGKDILSIYASANYYGGGPYPTNDSNMSVTFDLRTGNKVQFAELFRSYDTDKEQILKIFWQPACDNRENACCGKEK